MKQKTATDQSFNGRRIAMTMMVLICVEVEGDPDMPEDQGDCIVEIHTAVCIAIDDDTPVFRDLNDLNDDELVRDFSFVPSENDLIPGTWTFKERV